MRIFNCGTCRRAVYFESTLCVHCSSLQAFDPRNFQMQVVGEEHRLCANASNGACNWLADKGANFCRACSHNLTVPDLSIAENLANWRRIEQAKRHLFYSILTWQLPAPTKAEDLGRGLAFEFLSDVEGVDGTVERVMTGHDNGLITINIAEGDDVERERRRKAMGEPYRTLLGHFRHEIGHYYWDRLAKEGGKLTEFRTVFGDEREEYLSALKRHHELGAPAHWSSQYISAYATAHPWEDFAETFAHFVHMVDTLETAKVWGLHLASTARAVNVDFDPYRIDDVEQMHRAWVPLTLAINALNRSMGQPDLYPFVTPPAVVKKLGFTATLLAGAASKTTTP
ncbi:MAG: zinc-binding metallopeptidase family protein [Neoaquamicrobium sediminum]|uniref:zinc-binding metallopeptidase family protein n=1 Tax=Neoaquamicrobium sediminum TaxID=1849104 RepID=UPI004035ED2F